MITADELAALCPWLSGVAEETAKELSDACESCDAITPIRAAMFLAQAAHESNGFRTMRENMNYSPAQLVTVWPSRFVMPDAFVPVGKRSAIDYAHQPEKLANFVYGNRGGNGDEASGDGWKYRAAGFGITFRDNFAACSKILFHDEAVLIDEPEQVGQQFWLAAQSFAWYWKANDINKFADVNDLDGVSDVINRGRKTAAQGDAIGYADRKEWFRKFSMAMGVGNEQAN